MILKNEHDNHYICKDPMTHPMTYYNWMKSLLLNLSKIQSELLGSRLQGWNLLEKGTKVTYARKRGRNLTSYFSITACGLVYCNNINGLMDELGREHKPYEWRLFIDASKLSLKAVLLFNGNTYPSVLVAYTVNIVIALKAIYI